MARKKNKDPIPGFVTAARLLLAVEMKATTGQRAAAFLAAASAELLSIAGGDIDVAQHPERFETYLDQPEVKIGQALGDALSDAGPFCASSVMMRLAKNLASSDKILSIDRRDFARHMED